MIRAVTANEIISQTETSTMTRKSVSSVSTSSSSESTETLSRVKRSSMTDCSTSFGGNDCPKRRQQKCHKQHQQHHDRIGFSSMIRKWVSDSATNSRRKAYDEDPVGSLFHLCRSRCVVGPSSSTVSPPCNKKSSSGFSGSSSTLLLPRDTVNEDISYILDRHPETILAVDERTGYNILHMVCSNPTLLFGNKRLIQLLVETSERVSGCNGLEENNDHEEKKQVKFLDKENNSITQASHNSSIEAKGGSADIVDTCSNEAVSLLPSDLPKAAYVLSEKTLIRGQLPLHLALMCTASSSSGIRSNDNCAEFGPAPCFDVLEYLIQCHPSAVCSADKIHQNLPLHEACCIPLCYPLEDPHPPQRATLLEVLVLLIQQWPESCKIQNRDGNLPLHLVLLHNPSYYASALFMASQEDNQLYQASPLPTSNSDKASDNWKGSTGKSIEKQRSSSTFSKTKSKNMTSTSLVVSATPAVRIVMPDRRMRQSQICEMMDFIEDFSCSSTQQMSDDDDTLGYDGDDHHQVRRSFTSRGRNHHYYDSYSGVTIDACDFKNPSINKEPAVYWPKNFNSNGFYDERDYPNTSSNHRTKEEEERDERERNELKQQQYLDQSVLEIVQYLVHVYPDALHVSNKNGFTPFQLAQTVRRTQTKYSINKKNPDIYYDPVVEFLRNPTTKLNL